MYFFFLVLTFVLVDFVDDLSLYITFSLKMKSLFLMIFQFLKSQNWLHKLFKLLVFVLSFIVGLSLLHYQARLILYHGFPFFENITNFLFLFQKINSYLPSRVINEGGVVQWASNRWNMWCPPHVYVNQV